MIRTIQELQQHQRDRKWQRSKGRDRLVDLGSPVASCDGFWARIERYDQLGSFDYTGTAATMTHYYNWRYTFKEVSKTARGYGGWTVILGGRTGSAFNSIEDSNGPSGVLGNGVNYTNMLAITDGGFSLQPCPVGTIVRMYLVNVVDDTPEYWFSYENGVDGACA